MFKFQYNIELNDDGRPFIYPINETEKEMGFVEHKFMGLELARSVIGTTIQYYEKVADKRPLPVEEIERLKYLESELIRISNVYSSTIKEQFELLGIADRLLNNNFDLTVMTSNERDNLNYNGIIYDDKIYKREIGLKVKVLQTGEIFELRDGVDNIHWTKI